ncbi:hypothetical protein IPH25_04550 [bacterium]|nr:MAG: hypothetical protein IPG37_01545 [bacterium]QQR61713.1 MAG: hypothetical protein IPH25_04550 [bacterium]QQR62719.1 MAG: hypothetical protein IPH67_04885 [bacterium]
MKKILCFCLLLIGLFPGLCKADGETWWEFLRRNYQQSVLVLFDKSKIDRFEKLFDAKVKQRKVKTYDEAMELQADILREFFALKTSHDIHPRSLYKGLLKDDVVEQYNSDCIRNGKQGIDTYCQETEKSFAEIYHALSFVATKKFEEKYPWLKEAIKQKKIENQTNFEQ